MNALDDEAGRAPQLRVFISSTYRNNRERRQLAAQVISELDMVPVRME